MNKFIKFFQFLIVGVLFPLYSAQSATLTVDSTVDAVDASPGDGTCATADNTCTLRAAIQEATQTVEQDVINVPAGTYVLTIEDTFGTNSATGELDLFRGIELIGAGPTLTIIDANQIDRVFLITDKGTNELVTVKNMTIMNGNVNNGGSGIFISNNASVLLENVVIKDNTNGSGIAVSGSTVTIKNSLIKNNYGAAGAGGLMTTAGATVHVINTTISGNTSDAQGGGVYIISDTDVVTFDFVTIANNMSNFDDNGIDHGGGIFSNANASVTISHTIIANNEAKGAAISEDCTASLISSGYNIIGVLAFTCDISGNMTGVQTDVDPLLGSLQVNGLGSETHALLANSPAIDTGATDGCKDYATVDLDQDQRGANRNADGNGNGAVACDIGAFEVGCGDGMLQSFNAEECDDGNASNQDSCLTTCKSATCGDGFVETGKEACDAGAANSNSTKDACRTTCKNPSCGDGTVDTGEGCDDGNNVDADGCQANCALPTCGDGILDAGEQCDNGASNSNTTADTCRTTCVNAACGDGVVDTGEACDDGNSTETDACLNTCVQATCGDGVVQSDVEACDAGSANSNSTKDTCRTTCVNPKCGDGVVDAGEECDDDSDACEKNCTLKISPIETDPEEPAAKDTTENDDTTDVADTTDTDATDVDDTTVDSTDTPADKNASSGTSGGCGLIQDNRRLPAWLFLLFIPAIAICFFRACKR